jgi:cytochrome P450
MSPEELRDELVTMLVAGHETTASSLSFALAQISRDRDVLGRLTDEIDAGEDDAYLTATINETLRRRPVLQNAEPRFVVRECEIGGRRYRPGVALVASAYLVHHDAAIYPEPYAFRPERFLDEKPGTYSWIPFGGGRRRCIGASFATVEMKIVLREILSRCDIRAGAAGPELTRRRNITVRPGLGASTVVTDRARVPAPA